MNEKVVNNTMSSGQHEMHGSEGHQYLTFMLNGEEYGIDILNVMEIRGWEEPTPLPEVPAYIRGVIDLRGLIVPILDLRERFNLPSADYSALTVIIVLQFIEDGKKEEIGIVVDAVSEVYSLTHAQIKTAPAMGHQIDRHYISGLVTLEDKMLIVLDTKRLMHLSEVPNPEALHTPHPPAVGTAEEHRQAS